MSNPTLTIYTKEELIYMFDNWLNFSGFVGGVCWNCDKTHNVMTGRLGNFGFICCNCEKYNAQPMNVYYPMYEFPDYGTPSKVIIEAWHESEKYKSYNFEEDNK